MSVLSSGRDVAGIHNVGTPEIASEVGVMVKNMTDLILLQYGPGYVVAGIPVVVQKTASKVTVILQSQLDARVGPVLTVLLVDAADIGGGGNVLNAAMTATVVLKIASAGNVIMPSQMESRAGPMLIVLLVIVAVLNGGRGKDAAR